MAHAEKSRYYRALKNAGVEFDKHYRMYTTAELKEAYGVLAEQKGWPAELDAPPSETDLPKPQAAPTLPPHPPAAPVADPGTAKLQKQIAELTNTVALLAQRTEMQGDRRRPTEPEPIIQQGAPDLIMQRGAPEPIMKESAPEQHRSPTTQGLDPDEHAGITLNTHVYEPVEVDAAGNKWFQKEVRKPGYAKPRGRRVLREAEYESKKQKVQDGRYTESFEVAGEPTGRESEVKITLPSYQTGIYQAPNMPFKIHTYNGVRGFDLRDVQRYYGGSDLVPDTIKRCYVSTDLCFDITTTIRAIENEYRERVLKKGA